MIAQPAATALATPSPEPAVSEFVATGSATTAATPRPFREPIPMPSLKPGEVITWIRIERPRLELGQILVGSAVLVGLILALAVVLGVILGHLRSKRLDAHGTGGLRLR